MLETRKSFEAELLNLCDQVETTGTISRHDYFQLMTLLLANQITTPEQSARINAIFDRVRLRQVRVVD